MLLLAARLSIWAAHGARRGGSRRRVPKPPKPFDESPQHDVYDRYEFPDPPRIRGHAEN
jgi:hypothetical protein